MGSTAPRSHRTEPNHEPPVRFGYDPTPSDRDPRPSMRRGRPEAPVPSQGIDRASLLEAISDTATTA